MQVDGAGTVFLPSLVLFLWTSMSSPVNGEMGDHLNQPPRLTQPGHLSVGMYIGLCCC